MTWEYPAVRIRSLQAQGGPKHATTFVAEGDGFEVGAQVFLVLEGGSLSRPTEVIETRDIRCASQSQLRFTGDLTDNKPGWYDAYVILPSRGNSTFTERSAWLGQAYRLEAGRSVRWSERVLSSLRPEIPAALVPEDAWGRIMKAADAGPEISHGDVSFECHLLPDQSRVDLILRLMPGDRDAFLDQPKPGKALERTAGFLRQWGDPRAGFAHVPWVDLENDLDTDAVHEPFLGPGIEAYYDRSAEEIEALRTHGAATVPVANPAVAGSVLAAYADPKVSKGVLERVAAAVEALPPGGFVTGVGSLGYRLSAQSEAARLVVSLRRQDVRPYFDRVGWPIPQQAMNKLLGTAKSRVSLDLDVASDGLQKRVAKYHTFQAPYAACPRLQETLAMLREAKLAKPARLDAVQAWVAAERSPQARAKRVLTLKVIAGEAGPESAKAYLTFTMGSAAPG